LVRVGSNLAGGITSLAKDSTSIVVARLNSPTPFPVISGTLDQDVAGLWQKPLSDSGPEATDLFNRMVNGLISNKLSVTDIQSQAKSVLAELYDLKKDFDDPEIGGLLNQYGSILQTFLNQTAAESKSTRTNSMPKLQKTPAALK
jgi:hypothetical protein